MLKESTGKDNAPETGGATRVIEDPDLDATLEVAHPEK